METDRGIEEKFGLTREQIEKWDDMLVRGEIPGMSVGDAIIGNVAADAIAIRLLQFEELLADWVAERESVEATLGELRAQGKVRTATYQQLTARKLALQSILGQCEERGLL